MTKIFFPQPREDISTEILRLDRDTLSLCIAFITGHNNLGYHHNLRDPLVSNRCRFCQEEVESASHLLASCPRLNLLRFNIIGVYQLNVGLDLVDSVQLVSFISNPAVNAALRGLQPEYLLRPPEDWSDTDPDPPTPTLTSSDTDDSMND